MTCEEFESLLADALGDELSPEDRPAFSSHLDACPRCRHEHDSAAAALVDLRRLSPPPFSGLSVEHRDPSLLIGRPLSRWGTAVRSAAAVLLAFAAGYLVRDRLPASTSPAENAASPRSIEAQLAVAYRTDPLRPDLAKCLSALWSE